MIIANNALYSQNGNALRASGTLAQLTVAVNVSAHQFRQLDFVEQVLAILPRFQVQGHKVIDYRLAYPRKAFDAQSIEWDLNYFKYHFLKLAHVPFNEQRLENDFERLIAHLLSAEETVLVATSPPRPSSRSAATPS